MRLITKKKKFLFFFVHPSKFHVFRHTINHLIRGGHSVDIVITQKDVLEQLLINEGWKFKNIFPKGRKIKHLPVYLSSAINFVITILRLYRHVRNRQYDLFITDDLLVVVGKVKRVPSIVFIDDDLKVVKQFGVILRLADYCLSPGISDLGPYNAKKIPFNGYKELAYLHPNHFSPDYSVVKSFNPKGDRYFIIRAVLLKSYHDVGKRGLSDENLRQLVLMLEKHGKVYISSERRLPKDLEKYRLRIEPNNIAHVLYFADMYIGDSQTMASEAAILGVPTFRINDFAGKISVMNEKEEKYGLSRNYSTAQFGSMLDDISICLRYTNRKKEVRSRSLVMLKEKMDLSGFMIWLLENFSNSVEQVKYYDNQSRFVQGTEWKERL